MSEEQKPTLEVVDGRTHREGRMENKKRSWAREATQGGILAAALLIVAGLIYGGYVFKRWINWKFSYEAKVEERVVPLEKRVGDLEERVRKLEAR